MNQKLVPGMALAAVWCWFLSASAQTPVLLFSVLSLSAVSGFFCLSFTGPEMVTVFRSSPLCGRGRVTLFSVLLFPVSLLLSVVELSSKTPVMDVFSFLFTGVPVSSGSLLLFLLISATSAVVLSVGIGFCRELSLARTVVRAIAFLCALLSIVPVTGVVSFGFLILFSKNSLEPCRFSLVVVSLLGAIRVALHYKLFVGSVLVWPAALLFGISLCFPSAECLKEAENA